MTTQTLTRPQAPAPRPAATAYAVETTGLQKMYGGRVVVDDLNLPAGVVSGFVGPNGDGKTTTIRMLLGLFRPTAGTGHLMRSRRRADVILLVTGSTWSAVGRGA